ncbi:pyridoxal-dependent decarboxylase, exosortase A system-associated [Sphingobium chlorophenolicum]|uniref:Pyridoxal-dependent decarboxylase, exosortase system type 1 associated n=1 Tax=Sphingobium chlorophenolicum TaxID=46429 RepID=A0A081RFN3_SPHCR|nr:pyridoxal-dependent decarboxylase, exosortase A system-associated [Sphingobium chlorophenolicum]KEQ54006.1 Pyridoxal-dependent decarboxylase, exosortase system type 1 associated [Sphingobium chlorophenolicum]
MKPMGPIPPFFTSEEGMLLIGGSGAASLVDEAGDTPLFVYDMAIIEEQARAFRDAMPLTLSLHYAVKANPYAPLLQRMAKLVDGFDVASGGELTRALEAGMDPAHISFAGPGKRDDELIVAIDSGATINLESEGEARRAIALGEQRGRTPKLAIRVNPDFDLKGSGMRMGGGAKPFGVDADRAADLARRVIDAGADWRGWHIFAGSQALGAEALIETQAATIDLATRLSDAVGVTPPLVNLGGGFGIPYFPGDERLDIRPIGEALGKLLEQRADILQGSEFAMELGRWLVGEAGVYLTRIVDIKKSQGETFIVVDGGLHHQLAASGNFGTVVRRNYPIAVANRFGQAPAQEAATVVGCLCTPIDRLGDKVALPPVEEGDLIAIFLAGAYGASASPAAFLGHPAPLELLIG